MSEAEGTLGGRIQARRTAYGLTQDQLAQAINVSVSQISRWENNHDVPNQGSLSSLAALFQTTVQRLCGVVGDAEGDIQEALAVKKRFQDAEKARSMPQLYAYLRHDLRKRPPLYFKKAHEMWVKPLRVGTQHFEITIPVAVLSRASQINLAAAPNAECDESDPAAETDDYVQDRKKIASLSVRLETC